MAARPIGGGRSGWPWSRSRSRSIPATKSGANRLHQIHEPSGKRIKYEKVVPGIGPVDRDEIVKGYEVEKGEYVLLEHEEIEKVKLESRKTLELTQFVDLPTSTRSITTSPITSSRRRPRRGSLRRAARGAAQGEEGRHRPARHARPGICRQPQALRPRHGAGDAALRRRGQQGAQLFPRHRRRQARPGPARHRRDADRQEDRRLRRRPSSTTATSTR